MLLTNNKMDLCFAPAPPSWKRIHIWNKYFVICYRTMITSMGQSASIAKERNITTWEKRPHWSCWGIQLHKIERSPCVQQWHRVSFRSKNLEYINSRREGKPAKFRYSCYGGASTKSSIDLDKTAGSGGGQKRKRTTWINPRNGRKISSARKSWIAWSARTWHRERSTSRIGGAPYTFSQTDHDNQCEQ